MTEPGLGRSTSTILHSPPAAAGNDIPLVPTGPLFIWLALQTLAVASAALRVPLWAHAPEGGEFLALHVLIVVQILGASLLMPQLLNGWRALLVTMATAWPFLLLAGLLAATPFGAVTSVGCYVSAWIAALAIWRFPLPSTKAQFTVSATLAAWAATGPVLLYCRAEFTPMGPPMSDWTHVLMGPIAGGTWLAHADGQVKLLLFLPLAALAFTAASIGLVRTVFETPSAPR